MKTILKFLALIAVGVGLVVGAFSLMNGEPGELDSDVVSDASYTELNDRIEATYNNGVLTEWNMETYTSIYKSIVSSSRNNYIDQYDRNSLINKLGIYASRQLEVILKNEYAKPDCKREDIRRLIKDGIDEVAKGWNYQSEDTDGVIKRHSDGYRLYGDILSFDYPSYTPGVKESDGRIVWTSIENYKDTIKKIRDGYLKNDYYKTYLSNITAVSKALNEGRMNRCYQTAENGYREEVMKGIINFFSTKERNNSNANLFYNAYIKFLNEKEDTFSATLWSKYQEFKKEVDGSIDDDNEYM